jgi:hypothetical protein
MTGPPAGLNFSEPQMQRFSRSARICEFIAQVSGSATYQIDHRDTLQRLPTEHYLQSLESRNSHSLSTPISRQRALPEHWRPPAPQHYSASENRHSSMQRTEQLNEETKRQKKRSTSASVILSLVVGRRDYIDEAGGPGTDSSSSRSASTIQSVPRSSRSCDERAAGGPDLRKNFIQLRCFRSLIRQGGGTEKTLRSPHCQKG